MNEGPIALKHFQLLVNLDLTVTLKTPLLMKWSLSMHARRTNLWEILVFLIGTTGSYISTNGWSTGRLSVSGTTKYLPAVFFLFSQIILGIDITQWMNEKTQQFFPFLILELFFYTYWYEILFWPNMGSFQEVHEMYQIYEIVIHLTTINLFWTILYYLCFYSSLKAKIWRNERMVQKRLIVVKWIQIS